MVIKLIKNKSTIFVGGEKFAICRAGPISIPMNQTSKYKKIESINDILDGMDPDLIEEDLHS